MECRKNELPGASRKTVRQRRKNAADKTLGNRALSVAAGSRSVPAGAYPRIRGEPFRLWMAPTAYRGLAALLRTATPGVFSEEGTIQRNTRRTASPPSKMIAEGKRGRRFYERLPRTVLNLLQYADGLKDGGGGFNALVSGLGARAFDGLLDVVRGQQAEAHRTPLSRDTWARPLVASAATKSK